MKKRYSIGKRRGLHQLALGVLALGGIVCLLAMAGPAPADPSRGRGDSPQAFLSGGERSLSILREIKDVLERIDARLEQMDSRLERIDGRLERVDSRLEQMDAKLARINVTPGTASQPPPPETMEILRGRDR